MKGNRHKARQLALQCLYQWDFNPDREVGVTTIKVNFEAPKKAMAYAEALVAGVRERRVEIDEILNEHSHQWRLERMDSVDRNILRLATYEIRFIDDVPPQVAINEAMELAKRFSAGEALAFINGILDAVAKAD
ncbi:MAG: transcription antitermination factor NusB [Thermodesulfobacteriota bacterium]